MVNSSNPESDKIHMIFKCSWKLTIEFLIHRFLNSKNPSLREDIQQPNHLHLDIHGNHRLPINPTPMKDDLSSKLLKAGGSYDSIKRDD